MRKLLLTTTALLSLTTGAAFAELSTQQIADMFPGAAQIEIKRGLTTTKVEAIVGAEKIEVIFDNATDAVLKREVETLSGDDLAEITGSCGDDNDDDDSTDDSDDDGCDDDLDDDDLDDDSDDDEDDDSDDDSDDDNDDDSDDDNDDDSEDN